MKLLASLLGLSLAAFVLHAQNSPADNIAYRVDPGMPVTTVGTALRSASFISSFLYTAGSGGTTVGLIVKLDGAGNVVTATTSDPDSGIGIAEATVTAGSKVMVALYGSFLCVASSTVTEGDLLVNSTSQNGHCADSSQTVYSSVSNLTGVLGKAASSGVSGAFIEVVLNGPGHFGTQVLSTAGASYQTLTDSALISWNAGGALKASAQVVLQGNRVLNLSNQLSGGDYTLQIVQDSVGSRTLTLSDSSCIWKVAGGGAGVITLDTAPFAIDFLRIMFDGINCYGTLQKNYN